MSALLLSLVLLGCSPSPPPEETMPPADDNPADDGTGNPSDDLSSEGGSENASAGLAAVLAAQPEEARARYRYRHPQETLEFFGIEPGMTVVEALPGGGWYSSILIPWLGADGRLIGANYASSMWPKFGTFGQDFVDSMKTWTTDWPVEARQWQGPNGARVEAFAFGSLPASMEGQADAVLVVRALHNLARFEGDGEYLSKAIGDMYRVLKPGGILGVVQHKAREGMPDEWADGHTGYLKQEFVVARLEQAGFELVATSNLNENPKDQPTADDVVWRLPPSYQTSDDNPDLKARMDEIGESNRMTLKFRKPAM